MPNICLRGLNCCKLLDGQPGLVVETTKQIQVEVRPIAFGMRPRDFARLRDPASDPIAIAVELETMEDRSSEGRGHRKDQVARG
jgi:hypothetical protein